MAKPRVEIKPMPADVAAQIADELAARTFAAPASDEPFQPHITEGTTSGSALKAKRPLPPKPAERPRNLLGDNFDI